jgi:hypothetical protein
MGKIEYIETKPFTKTDLHNKDLIMKMLKYEDTLIHGITGKEMYNNDYYMPRCSLNPEYALNRMTLTKFGFDTSDESVDNYRSIFRTYHKSAVDYDKEVMSCVTYMRENKCVYYTSPIINVGDKIPDCTVYKLNGKDQITLFDKLGSDFKYAFVAAFSTS